MTVLGVLLSAPVYRIFLGQAQSVRTRLYVDAARVNGVSSLRVNLRHVLPAMATTIAVQAAQLFAIGVLIEAGLAFMGFGPSVPSPSWGGLIADASQHVYTDPWLMVPTGVVLALTVIAANVLADTVQGGEPATRERVRQPAAAPGGAAVRQWPGTDRCGGRYRASPAAVAARRLTRTRCSTCATSPSRSPAAPAWSPASRSRCGRGRCSAWSASPAAARR